MSKIDIKVGETYYVRVKVTEKMNDKIITRTVSNKGAFLIESHTIFFDDEVLAFSPVPRPAPIKFFKSTRIPEAYPKYDPNREFRVGDKVSVRKIHGKLPQCRYNGMVKVNEGDCCTIHEKEHRNCYWVTIPSGGNWCFDAAYLDGTINRRRLTLNKKPKQQLRPSATA